MGLETALAYVMTEVVVLDEERHWEGDPVADEILTRLETALNQAGR